MGPWLHAAVERAVVDAADSTRRVGLDAPRPGRDLAVADLDGVAVVSGELAGLLVAAGVPHTVGVGRAVVTEEGDAAGHLAHAVVVQLGARAGAAHRAGGHRPIDHGDAVDFSLERGVTGRRGQDRERADAHGEERHERHGHQAGDQPPAGPAVVVGGGGGRRGGVGRRGHRRAGRGLGRDHRGGDHHGRGPGLLRGGFTHRVELLLQRVQLSAPGVQALDLLPELSHARLLRQGLQVGAGVGGRRGDGHGRAGLAQALSLGLLGGAGLGLGALLLLAEPGGLGVGALLLGRASRHGGGGRRGGGHRGRGHRGRAEHLLGRLFHEGVVDGGLAAHGGDDGVVVGVHADLLAGAAGLELGVGVGGAAVAVVPGVGVVVVLGHDGWVGSGLVGRGGLELGAEALHLEHPQGHVAALHEVTLVELDLVLLVGDLLPVVLDLVLELRREADADRVLGDHEEAEVLDFRALGQGALGAGELVLRRLRAGERVLVAFDLDAQDLVHVYLVVGWWLCHRGGGRESARV